MAIQGHVTRPARLAPREDWAQVNGGLIRSIYQAASGDLCGYIRTLFGYMWNSERQWPVVLRCLRRWRYCTLLVAAFNLGGVGAWGWWRKIQG